MGHVRLITRFEHFSALASDWKALSCNKLTRSWDFHRCWLEHFSNREALRVLVYEHEGRIQGILPLVEERRLWTGRTLVNFGSGKACLDDLGIVAHSCNEFDVAREFADYLLNTRELPWDYVVLEGIRSTDSAMLSFAEGFKCSNGDAVERRADASCWAIALKANEDGYHHWSKRLRSLMRKAREEERRGDLEFHVASSAQEAFSDLEVMGAIHQARWQDRGIDGCFSSESFTGFTRGLLQETFDTGSTFVAILRWKGKPAAGAICFRDSETIYVYLASMSPEFPEEKPGWKLNGYLADYALRLGCKSLDLMRGDEEYKQRMGATPSAQEKWLIASPKFWGRVHRTLYRTAREIKHFISLPTPVSSTSIQETTTH